MIRVVHHKIKATLLICSTQDFAYMVLSFFMVVQVHVSEMNYDSGANPRVGQDGTIIEKMHRRP